MKASALDLARLNGDSYVLPEMEPALDTAERAQLQKFLAGKFRGKLEVRARPQKKDSAEVYLDGEFVAVISEDKEDGELSYHLTWTILDLDLEEEN